MRSTLLYTHPEAVIPAKLVPACIKRGVGIQLNKTGFRIKPGRTIKASGLCSHLYELQYQPLA
jgi:hypothetical protein